MRPWLPVSLAFAAIAAAQDGKNNVVNNPPGGIQASVGEPLTVSWQSPSSGPVTVKIRSSDDVEPEGGMVVAEGIENTGAVTFIVPEDVPTGEVFIQIVDDVDQEDYNFSNGFEVSGATNDDVDPSTTVIASASAVPPPAGAATAADVTRTSSSQSTSISSSNENSAPATLQAHCGLAAVILVATIAGVATSLL